MVLCKFFRRCVDQTSSSKLQMIEKKKERIFLKLFQDIPCAFDAGFLFGSTGIKNKPDLTLLDFVLTRLIFSAHLDLLQQSGFLFTVLMLLLHFFCFIKPSLKMLAF